MPGRQSAYAASNSGSTRKAPTKKRIVKLKEEDGTDRKLQAGKPDYTRCDNTLITSKYTFLNFLPIVSSYNYSSLNCIFIVSYRIELN